jgi:hypothetical protein
MTDDEVATLWPEIVPISCKSQEKNATSAFTTSTVEVFALLLQTCNLHIFIP